MKLYLVRHGQTEGNLTHIYQNDTDQLSDKGRSEAEVLARRFETIALEAIISSPYSRARETAAPIAQYKKLPLQTNELLVEKRWPKELEGKSASDQTIQELKSLLQEKEHTDPEWRYSNEERYIDVRKRMAQFLSDAQTLAAQYESILVVSHAHVLKVFLAVMMHGPEVSAKLFRDIFHTVSLHNTGITVAEYSEGKWHLLTINDHAHLGDYHRQLH
jgi:broad specificity phosphatase PhoE